MLRCFVNSFSLLVLCLTLLSGTACGGQPGPSSIVEQIDTLIRQQWADSEVRPSEMASEGEWLRRVYLDLLGRVPTRAEFRSYQRDRSASRRKTLIRRLLHDEAYTSTFSRNWATVWSNWLVGRSAGSERNSFVNRDGFQKYLRDAFAANRSYDRMVRDMLVATGTNKPGLEDFNGAVNFLAMKLDDKASQATADVSRLFLGKQVQCTQCHDHPFNDWKQNQFWELNSFFRQAVPLRRFDPNEDNRVSHVELADQDFGGEGNSPSEAEVYFEVRDGTLEAAYPVFVDGTKLDKRSGYISDVNRREELANFVVQSPDLSRAVVNRLWAYFFHYGFTNPVDDMGPHNPPTHPELLDFLAEEFERNSYDLRLLMTWIVSSEAYSLSSRMTKHNAEDDPSKGSTPLFSHFYLRQMRAEQLFDSLLAATAADRLEDQSRYDATRRDWLKQFVVAFGNDEGTEGSTFDGTIAQSLVLFNGELVQQTLSIKPGSWLHRVAYSENTWERKVNILSEAAFCRPASTREQTAAKKVLEWRDRKVAEALQDIWWAYINSNEFILNH